MANDVAEKPAVSASRAEARLAWALMLPALSAIALIAVVPIGWASWESLHLHDLRMPWLGRPFVGAANYREAFSDRRFLDAAAHTAAFTTITVIVELIAGLALAVAIEGMTRGRGLVRTAILLPWAVPTVVVALVWRFMFESPGGLASSLIDRGGAIARSVFGGAPWTPPTWFAEPLIAWVPVMLADIWKTTPFVTILLLAGLQSIDRSLYEAAAIDGASRWRTFRDITLPLLTPALLVALVFRSLDAFRVFDVIFVMTNGGPGTATESIAIYAFGALLQNLRFGFGSALAVIVFLVTFVFALVCVRLLGRDALMDRSA